MKYLIIGLGIYGSNLATDLTNLGHEVIGVDINAPIVESLKDYISTAYVLDATDENALKLLPLTSIDLAIVAIGENFGASVRIVAILKKEGVKHIYARAVDKLHESILEGFGIDRIVTPEQRAATDLVLEMALGTPQVRSLDTGCDMLVVSFNAPQKLVGLPYSELELDDTVGITLLTVARFAEATNDVGLRTDKATLMQHNAPDEIVSANDRWTCYGSRQAYRKLCRNL